MGMFDNIEKVEARQKGQGNRLPVGGYIARIIKAREIVKDKYSALVIDFDIAEGEYKDYFMDMYRKSTSDKKSYRGTFYNFYPQENEYYDSNASVFKYNMEAIEKSNTGFKTRYESDNINPQSIAELAGKMVGVIFFEKEYIDRRGMLRTGTNVWGLEAVENIRNGNFEIPEKQVLKQDSDIGDIDGFGEYDGDPF